MLDITRKKERKNIHPTPMGLLLQQINPEWYHIVDVHILNETDTTEVNNKDILYILRLIN